MVLQICILVDYSFEAWKEYWAWWSRHIYYNRYDISTGEPYIRLMELLQNKIAVITTNVDHQMQFAGVDK